MSHWVWHYRRKYPLWKIGWNLNHGWILPFSFGFSVVLVVVVGVVVGKTLITAGWVGFERSGFELSCASVDEWVFNILWYFFGHFFLVFTSRTNFLVESFCHLSNSVFVFGGVLCRTLYGREVAGVVVWVKLKFIVIYHLLEENSWWPKFMKK